MTIQIEDMLGDRVRTIEYICGGVEDSLADRAFITLPIGGREIACLLYTSPSPRDVEESRMPSSA